MFKNATLTKKSHLYSSIEGVITNLKVSKVALCLALSLGGTMGGFVVYAGDYTQEEDCNRAKLLCKTNCFWHSESETSPEYLACANKCEENAKKCIATPGDHGGMKQRDSLKKPFLF